MKKFGVIASLLVPVGIMLAVTGVFLATQSESEASIAPAVVKESSLSIAKSAAGNRQRDLYSQVDQVSISPEEFRCLAQGIYFEARSEPYEGQVAVAYVIMNRVKDHRFPDSICGVVFQNEHMRNLCQFSFACDGRSDNPYEMASWEVAIQIAERVLSNTYSDITARSTHYHATYVSPSWASHMRPTLQVGKHIFYREES
ncbi:cell wall hydrolase [Emcibacter nanhaiensis]|uniref:Cell wall hydrolase n=1 Tax=Emcibacter nanhaiensis TaxID=1505037 RepID=A0A501PNZ5_9PROT|nr:cell wall hydrolase [Emcibacter nanhaiensis]TPD61516.1 cell wall hydrolase [Emcibacter nanhaiensis]